MHVIQHSIPFKSVLLKDIVGNLDGNEKKFIELCYAVMNQCIIVNLDGETLLDSNKLSVYYLNETNENHALQLLDCLVKDDLNDKKEINYDSIDTIQLVEDGIAQLKQELANLQSQPQDDSEQDYYQEHQAAIKGIQEQMDAVKEEQQTAVEQSSLPVTVRKYSFLAS